MNLEKPKVMRRRNQLLLFQIKMNKKVLMALKEEHPADLDELQNTYVLMALKEAQDIEEEKPAATVPDLDEAQNTNVLMSLEEEQIADLGETKKSNVMVALEEA